MNEAYKVLIELRTEILNYGLYGDQYNLHIINRAIKAIETEKKNLIEEVQSNEKVETSITIDGIRFAVRFRGNKLYMEEIRLSADNALKLALFILDNITKKEKQSEKSN